MQLMRDGDRKQQLFIVQMRRSAASFLQKVLVVESRHYINVLSEISEDLHRIDRSVVKRNQLNFQIGIVLLYLRPYVEQEFGRRHDRGPDSD